MKSCVGIFLLGLIAIGLSAKGLMLSEIVQLKSQLKDTIDFQKNRLKERKLSEAKRHFIDNGLPKKSKPVSRVDRYLKPVKARYLVDGTAPHASGLVQEKAQLVGPQTLKARSSTASTPSSAVPVPKAKKVAGKQTTRGLAQNKKTTAFVNGSHKIVAQTKTAATNKLITAKMNKPNKKLVQLQLGPATKSHPAKKLMTVFDQSRANKLAAAKRHAKLKALKHKIAVKKALRNKKLSKSAQLAKLKKQIKASVLKGKKRIFKKHGVVKKRAVVKHHSVRGRSRHLNTGLNQKDAQLLAALSKKVQAIKEQNTQADLKAKTAPVAGTQPSAVQTVSDVTPRAAVPQRKLKTSTSKERSLLDLPSQNEFYSQIVDQYSDKF